MLKGIIVAAFVLMVGNCVGQSYVCKCWSDHPPSEYTPDSLITLPCGYKVAVCGNKIITKSTTFYTNLNLTICSSPDGRNPIEYKSDTCQFATEHDSVSVIVMKYLPIGENFEFMLIPFYFKDYYLTPPNESMPYYIFHESQYNIIHNNIKLLSDSKLQKVWQIYNDSRSEYSIKNKDIIGLLFLAAISGSEDLEHKFLSLKDNFSIDDNASDEYYKDLVSMLKVWKHEYYVIEQDYSKMY